MHYFLLLPCDVAYPLIVRGKEGQTNLGSYHHSCPPDLQWDSAISQCCHADTCDASHVAESMPGRGTGSSHPWNQVSIAASTHQSPCWEAGQHRWATTNKEQCNFSTCFLLFAMGGNTAREKLNACQEGCKNLCFLIGMFMQLQMLSVCYKLKMNVSIWWFFLFFGFFWSVFFAIWFHKALCALGKYRLETSRDVIIGPFFCRCNNMHLIKK